jgi:hypothetical protein
MLKIFWNFGTPYILAYRSLRMIGVQSRGISLAPFVEIFLWGIALLLSAFSDGTTWLNRPQNIAIWGIVVIVISYVHLVIAGMLSGWVISRVTRIKK